MIKILAKLRSKDKGFALLATFFALILLIAIISEMQMTTAVEYLAVRRSNADVKAYFAARGAIPVAIAVLEQDYKDDSKVDSFNDCWAKSYEPIEIEDGTINATISDEQGKYNLNRLITNDLDWKPEEAKLFLRLINAIDFNFDFFDYLDSPEDIVYRIRDYMDGDSSGEFETEACANNVIIGFEELLSIEGFTYEFVFGSEDILIADIKEDEEDEEESITDYYAELNEATPLKEEGEEAGEVWKGLIYYLTVQSGRDGLININTAPKAVLYALSDKVTDEIADSIMAHRESSAAEEEDTDPYAEEPADVEYQVFNSVLDLASISGPEKAEMRNLLAELVPKRGDKEGKRKITVRSHYFAADVSIKIAEKSYRYRAIIQRTPAGIIPLTWKEVKRKPEISKEDSFF